MRSRTVRRFFMTSVRRGRTAPRKAAPDERPRILPERDRRRGAIAVLAVACLFLMLVFVAFAVDVGSIVLTECELQNAADSAALSGVRALYQGHNRARQAARDWAARNAAANTPVTVNIGQDVEIGRWDRESATFTLLANSSSSVANAVRVTCRRTKARGNPLRLFFAPILGTRYADLTVRATAVLTNDICGSIIGIDRVAIQNGVIDSYDSSLGAFASQSTGRDARVCSDGPITIGPNGGVRGDARPGEGFSVSRPENVTGSTEPRTRPIEWSPVDTSEVASRNDNNRIPKWALTGQEGIALTNTEVLELPPGTYYLPGGLDISGSAALVVTGQTRLVIGGNVSVTGTGIVNGMLAPETLRVELYGSNAKFAGGAAFFADIYGPQTSIDIKGDAGFYGAVLAKDLNFSGATSRIYADKQLLHMPNSYSMATLIQ